MAIKPLAVFIAEVVAKLTALECNTPDDLRGALNATRNIAAQANTAQGLGVLYEALSAVAHNSGPKLKRGYRLELLELAIQTRMVAAQLHTGGFLGVR